jgi:hypothetical protein
MSCQALPISGFRPTTLQNQVLFAAVLYKNVNEALLAAGGADAFANAVNPNNTWIDQHGILVAPALLCATKGGVTITPGSTVTPLEIDSLRIDIEGMDIITRIRSEIQGNLVELGDPDILKLFLGSADKVVTNGMAKIDQRLYTCDEDHLANICAVGQISRTDAYLVAVLRGAKVVAPGAISTQDNQQANPQTVFRGYSVATAPTTPPMSYYEPVLGS